MVSSIRTAPLPNKTYAPGITNQNLAAHYRLSKEYQATLILLGKNERGFFFVAKHQAQAFEEFNLSFNGCIVKLQRYLNEPRVIVIDLIGKQILSPSATMIFAIHCTTSSMPENFETLRIKENINFSTYMSALILNHALEKPS